jgi:hypothetical protein
VNELAVPAAFAGITVALVLGRGIAAWPGSATWRRAEHLRAK